MFAQIIMDFAAGPARPRRPRRSPEVVFFAFSYYSVRVNPRLFPNFKCFVIILIGVALLIFGIFQIAAMISASAFVPVTAWSFLLPVICAGGGVLLLFDPFDAASTMTLVAGIAILIYGLSELFASWKMARAMKEYEIKFPSSDGKRSGEGKDSGIDFSEAKDADFRKVDEDK